MSPKITMVAMCVLLAAVPSVQAQKKSCEALQAEIEQKLRDKGIQDFVLEVVAAHASEAGRKTVGTCEGGRKKIVYSRPHAKE